MSVYDPHSSLVDFSTVHEQGEHGQSRAYGYAYAAYHLDGSRGSRNFAAALNTFAPADDESCLDAGAAEAAAPLAEAPDDKKVFSAARHGRHKEVEAALVDGFDPCFEDTFGNTIFHIACQNGNKRIAKLAIKYGGDMDARNLKGNTGLHFLFAYGYPEIAEYFIEKGADENVLNEAGKTAREGIR